MGADYLLHVSAPPSAPCALAAAIAARGAGERRHADPRLSPADIHLFMLSNSTIYSVRLTMLKPLTARGG